MAYYFTSPRDLKATIFYITKVFSHKYKTLRSGNTYDLHGHPEKSAHDYETTVATKGDSTEKNDGTSLGFSNDMIEERIKANFEPLHAQISALTQMMSRLIQGNSAREFTTANRRDAQLPSNSLPTDPEPLKPHR